ncbi:hypothetical protein M422DRAFT_260340 [Sphaerobolus stellatus SS14]|uniref:DUF5648 domain-containing protein n=1 Tax=Sphaerobolus stellatus (strain SS14) TaxID=990650 RepID=A0A0C9U2T6_SPHS4|nr:hypothetical protein M422DRAFT_260340 [Sphaerobolus stellatus SS14]
MKNFIFALASFSFYVNLLPTVAAAWNISTRSSATCGDPTTAKVISEWYNPSAQAHFLDVRVDFLPDNTSPGVNWQFQGSIFRSFVTQEPGTVPLYFVYNPMIQNYIFLTPDPSGNLPTVAGYEVQEIESYVYPTQSL